MAVTVVTNSSRGAISSKVEFEKGQMFYIAEGHLHVADDDGQRYGTFAPGSWVFAFTGSDAVVNEGKAPRAIVA